MTAKILHFTPRNRNAQNAPERATACQVLSFTEWRARMPRRLEKVAQMAFDFGHPQEPGMFGA